MANASNSYRAKTAEMSHSKCGRSERPARFPLPEALRRDSGRTARFPLSGTLQGGGRTARFPLPEALRRGGGCTAGTPLSGTLQGGGRTARFPLSKLCQNSERATRLGGMPCGALTCVSDLLQYKTMSTNSQGLFLTFFKIFGKPQDSRDRRPPHSLPCGLSCDPTVQLSCSPSCNLPCGPPHSLPCGLPRSPQPSRCPLAHKNRRIVALHTPYYVNIRARKSRFPNLEIGVML